MPFRHEPLPPEPPRTLRWHLCAGAFGLTVTTLICWVGGVDLNASAALLLVVWALHGWSARVDARELGAAFWTGERRGR